MKTQARIGISHSLSDDAKIVHSTIIGRSAIGRISDLLSAWCEKELGADLQYLSDLRVLIQALMEFACPASKNTLGQVEMGTSEGILVLAARFECSISFNSDSVEKVLTQYWLNSDQAKLIKRVLYPHDRVEVRYHQKLNLIEWRVCRALKLGVVLDQDTSFVVLTDENEILETGTADYVDLGDLPFQEWLSDVYRNHHEKSNSGEVKIEGDATQDEAEWARIISEKESSDINQSIRISAQETTDEKEVVYEFSSEKSEKEVVEKASKYSDHLVETLLQDQVNLKESLKQITRELKQKELNDNRELVGLQQKTKKLEDLLKRKEIVNQRNRAEIDLMQKKLNEEKKSQKADDGKSQHFRNKALEMFEQLKKVKEKNTELEKRLFEIRNKPSAADENSGSSATENSVATQKLIDELNKKVERNARALEAEKAKVKGLSERVMIAEKEAQSAKPMVQDLESKIEHTMKQAQQHKKETDQVKQKLVQVEAEKNKIKNELVKAQAQIQTLMKRQAS